MYSIIIFASETNLSIIVFIHSRTLVDGLLAMGKGECRQAAERDRRRCGLGWRTDRDRGGSSPRHDSPLAIPAMVGACICCLGMQGSSRPLPSGQFARGLRPGLESKKHITPGLGLLRVAFKP